jgi:hypothetical protein
VITIICSCQRQIEKGAPKICGHKKGPYFDADLMISPLDQSCESRFAYAGDGSIRPMNKNDLAAKTTIKKLGLDCDFLRKMREKVIEVFSDDDISDSDQRQLVRSWLDKNEDGTFNQFFTTIKYLFPRS